MVLEQFPQLAAPILGSDCAHFKRGLEQFPQLLPRFGVGFSAFLSMVWSSFRNFCADFELDFRLSWAWF
jgi:hypothetical protein